jgi:S-(hydroxymethyl)glutathione dehydrogenase/alcohol dehydrogenase
MKAAVMRAFKAPLRIEDIQISEPGPRELLVRTAATGVCHSDLHVLEGDIPVPPPTVLGHEPSGVVEAVGSEVTHCEVGDHVIGCLSALGDETIPQFAHLSAFAEKMLVHENAVVKIRKDMPLDRAALIGCGVTTGLGAVLNTAQIPAGSCVAVIACGGVGLAAIQGCRIAGASRIIAIDNQPWKLELAGDLGATDGVDSSSDDAVAQVIEMTGDGVDFAFECFGLPSTCLQTVAMTRKGGTAVLVGVAPLGTMIELPGLDIVVSEKKILGSMMGSNQFRRDMPRYVEFYLNGQLKLDEMISGRLKLEEINTAFDALRKGSAARSVITFQG